MILGLAMLWCVSAVAHADCGTGPQPTFVIPDGRQATEDDMLEAQRDLRRYNDAVRAYANCLQAEQAQVLNSHDDSGQLRRKYADLTRDAVAQLASVADCLNQQVIAFKRGGGGTHAEPAPCSVGNGVEGRTPETRSVTGAAARGRTTGVARQCVQQCEVDREECDTDNIAQELTAASASAPAAAGRLKPMSCGAEAQRCEARCRGEYGSR